MLIGDACRVPSVALSKQAFSPGSPPQYVPLRFIFCTKKAISLSAKIILSKTLMADYILQYNLNHWVNAEKNRKILPCLIMFSNTRTFSRICMLLTKLHALKIYFPKIPHFLLYSRRKEKRCLHSYTVSLYYLLNLGSLKHEQNPQ